MGSGGGKRWLLAILAAALVVGCDLNPRPDDPSADKVGTSGNGGPTTPGPAAGGSGPTAAPGTGAGGAPATPGGSIGFPGLDAGAPTPMGRDAGADAADASVADASADGSTSGGAAHR